MKTIFLRVQQYSLSQFRGDLFGGLTAGVVALPLALAFGVASGAGAIAGLYGAIALGFFAALLGGTPSQVSGPTGPMTVIAAVAVALSVLGVIDSLLTSIVADSMTKERHDSNQELIGQGIGNMAAALIGGLPGAGATMRTVVNIKAGGTTRLSGMIHSLFLVAVLLGLGKYTAHIPMPVLAGILMKVGVDILDYRMLRVLRRAPRQDLVVMLTVFGITVFVDLIVAVSVGVTLAALLLTVRIARQTQINVTEVPVAEWQRDIEKGLQDESDYRMRTISVRGAFFFGTTALMQDKVNKLIGTKVVIINCLDVPFMDISAAFALSEMVDKLKNDGVKPILVVTEGLGLRRLLIGLGCGDLLGEDGIQVDYHKAVQLALAYLRETTPSRRSGEPPATP